ncbi:nucleoporin NUP35 isoform X2 [Homalodisca vitripennis]|uniref:Nucleoporin NUP53 n=1 Tax=Homalodisca liturata TaxID=320908 RepID=A0A1B6I023_9HEMI|nr:nucleoporin NUP35 isoform X2 [Homalodisca vitripennis]
MEPMTLGSPVGSPGAQNPTSPYLPGFLMGDPLPQPTSPSKTPRQVHFAPNLSSALPTPDTPLPPTSLNESITRYHKNQREKSGGPPTVGLFDTLEVSTSALSTTPPSTSFQPSGQLSQTLGPMTPTQNAQNTDENEKWVTVFGFPLSAASSILGQFSQVGHILEHRFPGQGNWVNICYTSKLDARRALSYNGKILGGHTMIGVVPCRDNSQPGSALRDMTNVLSGSGTPTTPKSPQVSRLSQQRRLLNSPCPSPFAPSPRGGRQLGISSPTENEVIGSQNTPTKSSSFVTKAVDLVFGW